MRRQIIFFVLSSLVMAFVLKDAPSEFLEIWVELRAAGEVSVDEYDSVWAQFILPQVALFLLVVMPVLIALGRGEGEVRRGRKSGFFKRLSILD